MPVLQPAEPWKQTGRYEIPELFKLRDRKDAELALAMTHEESVTYHVARRRALVPRAAADALPPPDQGARRAAAARGRAANARVHHEGRLQLRPRRGGTRSQLRAPDPGLRPDLRPRRAALVPRRVRRRDDGGERGARVHGAVRRGRERDRARAGLRRERRDRVGRAAERRDAAGPRLAARRPDAGADDGGRGLRGARRAARRGDQGDPGGRRRPWLRAHARARRPPAQRDQAAKRARRATSAPPRPRRSPSASGPPGSSGRSAPTSR